MTKKIKLKTKVVTMVALCLTVLLLFTACGGADIAQYELAYYAGTNYNATTGDAEYDKNLFYRNDYNGFSMADPFARKDKDGYFYLYGTYGRFLVYRSKDLSNWETAGVALGNDFSQDTEKGKAAASANWAPEVVFDEELDKYFMYFSSTPAADSSVVTGQGVSAGNTQYLMYVGISDSPNGPFEMVDFTDAVSSLGEGNLHTYNKEAGILDDSKYKVEETVNGETIGYKAAYPQYFAKYTFFNPETLRQKLIDLGIQEGIKGGYYGAIDPSPFVASNGDKYLFFSLERKICALKMINWLKPDWDSFTLCSAPGYYTVEDYKKALNGENVDKMGYETLSTTNEGPSVVEHNNKYYLTFSINSYKDQSYSVVQAVADSPLGPYRKLTDAENGLLLSTDSARIRDVSGPGHHSFVEADEKTYIVYHKHQDAATGGDPRYVNTDEVKWISIKDKDGNDLDVMYVNGPTTTIQPIFEFASEYKNIAEGIEAEVKGSLAESSSVKYLTDGLLPVDRRVSKLFNENYIHETLITKTTTFTYNFESSKEVRAVMVYNSINEDKTFQKVSRIEFVCEENGKEVTRFIKNLEFDFEKYGTVFDIDGTKEIDYVVPGSCVYAEFDKLNVKSIKITVEVPDNQKSVGISEIKILGK